jgi:hypothetical protein
MSDPAWARQMGHTRHEEDRNYFLPEHTARGFQNLYHELLT